MVGRLVLIAVVVVVVAPRFVRADEPAPLSSVDARRADELFLRGREQLKAGAYAEACESFDWSFAIDPAALGVMLGRAQCREKTGQLRAALALYRELLEKSAGARATAGSTTDAAKHAQRVAEARVSIASLERRIPTLLIAVDGKVARLLVDDVAVEAGPVRVDPGRHRVVAIAPSGRRVEATVAVAESGLEVVPLAMPRELVAAPTSMPWRPRLAVIALGASAVVTAGFGARYLLAGRADEREAEALVCSVRSCLDVQDALEERANRRFTLSTQLFIMGAVLGAGSVALNMVTRTSPRAARTAWLRPSVARTGIGIVAERTW